VFPHDFVSFVSSTYVLAILYKRCDADRLWPKARPAGRTLARPGDPPEPRSRPNPRTAQTCDCENLEVDT
jgi:hypothetical protein